MKNEKEKERSSYYKEKVEEEETMTKMGSCQLSLVSRSKASSSLANVPMLSRRTKCFSLTLDAEIKG